jgi:hypothetical protein
VKAMRGLLALVFIATTTAAGVSPVTVFFQFDTPPDPVTFSAMKAELDRLFLTTPFRFDWQRVEEASELSPGNDLVVLTFKGTCQMPLLPPLMDERGPYGWTSVTNGAVLPFSTIDCTRVRNAVHTALWGGERKRAPALLGRALGRVVAHELFHIFTRDTRHRSGVARASLSAAALIAESGVLHPEDLHPDKELLSVPSKNTAGPPVRDSLP